MAASGGGERDSAFLLYGLERPRLTPEGRWAIAAGLLLTALAAAWFPGLATGGFPLLSWTAALVPLALLLHYRGWRGVAAGYLAVALVVVGARLAAARWGDLADPWTGLTVYFWTLGAASAAAAVVLEAVRSAWRGGLTDPVTALPDRRLVDAFLRKQIAAARRGRSLSVALLAFDDLDEHDGREGGRGVGDDPAGPEDREAFFERVGRVLRANAREMDFIGRYGPNEFLAVMPGESSFGVSVFADRVRREVAGVAMPDRSGCTMSVGIASHEPGLGDPDEFVDRAEDALAWARSLGGDRVILYGRPAYREGPVSPHYQAEKRPVV